MPPALDAGGVVLRPAAPGVVGALVVVPGDDEREACGQVGQVGVALVLRVPAPVVGEADDLPGGYVPAYVDVALAQAVLTGRVLVQVVAEVQHRVQVVAGGEVPVGAEPTGLQVGAGHHAQPQPRDVGRVRRRGTGAPDAGHVPVEQEPVVVRRGRTESGRVHLDRVVLTGAGADCAAGRGAPEARVAGDLPADPDRRPDAGAGSRGRDGGDPRPQHDPVRSGSPEATPCAKTRSAGAASAAGSRAPVTPTAAVVGRNLRRFNGLMATSNAVASRPCRPGRGVHPAFRRSPVQPVSACGTETMPAQRPVPRCRHPRSTGRRPSSPGGRGRTTGTARAGAGARSACPR